MMSSWNAVVNMTGWSQTNKPIPPVFKYQGNACFWNEDIKQMSMRLRDSNFSSEVALSKAIINLEVPAQNLDMMILHDHFASLYHAQAITLYRDWFGTNKKRLLETMDACLTLDPGFYIGHFNKLLYDTQSFLHQVLRTPRFAYSYEAYNNKPAETLANAKSLVIAHQNPALKTSLSKSVLS